MRQNAVLAVVCVLCLVPSFGLARIVSRIWFRRYLLSMGLEPTKITANQLDRALEVTKLSRLADATLGIGIILFAFALLHVAYHFSDSVVIAVAVLAIVLPWVYFLCVWGLRRRLFNAVRLSSGEANKSSSEGPRTT
jgi:hypothetical protein